MAKTINELKMVMISGGPTGRYLLIGETILDGGDSDFRIYPGYNSSNITLPDTSKGIRTIDSWGITCRSAKLLEEPEITLNYNTTTDSEFLFVDTLANQTFDWWIEGDYMGA